MGETFPTLFKKSWHMCKVACMGSAAPWDVHAHLNCMQCTPWVHYGDMAPHGDRYSVHGDNDSHGDSKLVHCGSNLVLGDSRYS